MPVAVALAQALGAEATLGDVVAAVAEIASTLAALEAEFDAAHRDLKPDNLYHRDGAAAVGDFGLLWRPRQSDLTTARVPGAFSYTAPELFRQDLCEEEIDYHQADVFSLAKTLWALARGQSFAIPGPHEIGSGDLRVAATRPDPNGSALDRLLETATLASPVARPRMSEFASELGRWLALPAPGGAPLPDLSALTSQINEQMQPALARDAERRRWSALLSSAAAEVRSQLAELFEWMSSELPGSHVDVRDGDVRSMAQSYQGFGEGSVLEVEPIAASIDDGSEPLAYRLAFGLVLELSEAGQLRVAGAMVRGHQQVSADASEDLEARSAPIGSVKAEEIIRQACAWITINAPRWLADYAAAEK
jgi:serine/threonine protein kinase